MGGGDRRSGRRTPKLAHMLFHIVILVVIAFVCVVFLSSATFLAGALEMNNKSEKDIFRKS